MTQDQYVQMLKDFLLKNAVKSAFEFIVSKAAWLGWGPLGPIVKLILEKVLVVFLNHTELATFMLYTDFRVSRQGREFSEAAMNNWEVQKNGTAEEKEKAEKLLIDSFRKFVKLTN